jgi:aspartyl-tRNA(Asn)/glutamyl-tRNA(Gln) amidotransferase subunit A
MEFTSIKETSAKIKNKSISIKELNEVFIKRINENIDLNAYIYFNEENIQQQIASHLNKDTLLNGIPIAIKDLFCTKMMPTTAASKILKNFHSPYESFVTQKLLDEGAIFLGKTNCDEFAMGSANTTSYFGNVINPLSPKDKLLVPGGSSGGSAAAVAANLCLGATGTDTGGSIRQPASFCGIVGIKPTYGLCSRWGIVAFASSLDQAGILANNVEDAAILTQSIAGYDNKDSTSANVKIPNYNELINTDLTGKTVGIPIEYSVEGIPEEISIVWQKAIKAFERGGVKVKKISLPHTKYALPTYYIIAPAEASSNLARYDGVKYGYRSKNVSSLDEMYEMTRREGFGKEVKRRILIGTYVLSAGYYDAYYLKAQKVRKLIANDFIEAFKDCDFILTPTTPSSAFQIGEKEDDPIKMYLNDIFTVPASLSGIPGISIPFGISKKNLPLGVQILSKHFDEQTLFNVAAYLEKNNE